jgi:multisubunit Na+/H+ antiporter MnhB subunit
VAAIAISFLLFVIAFRVYNMKEYHKKGGHLRERRRAVGEVTC